MHSGWWVCELEYWRCHDLKSAYKVWYFGLMITLCINSQLQQPTSQLNRWIARWVIRFIEKSVPVGQIHPLRTCLSKFNPLWIWISWQVSMGSQVNHFIMSYMMQWCWISLNQKDSSYVSDAFGWSHLWDGLDNRISWFKGIPDWFQRFHLDWSFWCHRGWTWCLFGLGGTLQWAGRAQQVHGIGQDKIGPFVL